MAKIPPSSFESSTFPYIENASYLSRAIPVPAQTPQAPYTPESRPRTVDRAVRVNKVPNGPNVNPLEAFVRGLKEKLARHAPITLDDLNEFERKASEVHQYTRPAPRTEQGPYPFKEEFEEEFEQGPTGDSRKTPWER